MGRPNATVRMRIEPPDCSDIVKIKNTTRTSRSRLLISNVIGGQLGFLPNMIQPPLLDYIHFNPVKHGFVEHPAEWPHSSFCRYVAWRAVPGGVDGRQRRAAAVG
jgi:hypothetical protein